MTLSSLPFIILQDTNQTFGEVYPEQYRVKANAVDIVTQIAAEMPERVGLKQVVNPAINIESRCGVFGGPHCTESKSSFKSLSLKLCMFNLIIGMGYFWPCA